jgi:hypothetical protein
MPSRTSAGGAGILVGQQYRRFGHRGTLLYLYHIYVG